jgi:integrase
MSITVEPVINYRNKKNKKGLYSIHLRITIKRVQRYYEIKVPQKVRLDQWNNKPDLWVNNSHPYAFEINNRIIEKKMQVVDLIKRFYIQNKPVTFYAIDRELNRKGDRMVLNDYFDNYIKHPPENVNLDPITWEKYNAFLKHLNAFQSIIYFSEIDASFIARVKNYLANLKGRKGKMDPATIKSYFDKFKVVLNHAAKKENLLDAKGVEIFFEEVKISVPKKKEGQHIDIEDLQALRRQEFTVNEFNLRRDRDLFLFQVYTGFYYNDLQKLRKDQLFNDVEHGYYIISERDKNDNPTIIPLYKFPYAAEVVARYRDNNDKFEFLFRENCFIEVQAYNRNLKKLAGKAGISRNLTNKTGRHTNAQMWIRFGAERPVLSKMMGHEKEQTTENYYKVGLREVIEGTKSIDFGKLKI